MTQRKTLGDHVAAIPLHNGRILLLERRNQEWEFAAQTIAVEKGNGTFAQKRLPLGFGTYAKQALLERAGIDASRSQPVTVQVARLLSGRAPRASARRHRSILLPLEESTRPAVTLNPKEHIGHAWVSKDELPKYLLRPHERDAALLAFRIYERFQKK